MLPNQLHWLDIVEYAFFGITLISLLVAISTQTFFAPIVFLTLTLGLNIINRLRWQHLNRKRLSGLIKLQRQGTEDSTNTSQQTAISPEANAKILLLVQENLLSLERSLNGIVQYINDHALQERLEHLEKFYGQLKKERLGFSDPLIEDPFTVPIETETYKVELKLPSIHLTPIPASVAFPQWTCLYHLKGHTEGIEALTIIDAHYCLVSASWDRTLKLWELTKGDLISSVEAHDRGILALVSMNATQTLGYYRLATGSFDQMIKLWSLKMIADGQLSLELEQILSGHTGSIHDLVYAPQTSLLVSGSYDRTVKQWQLDTGQMLASSYDALGAIYALAVDPQERFIASGGPDGTITIWQFNTGEKLAFLGGNISSIESLVISPDGQTLAAGCVDGTIKLWQLQPQQFQADRSVQSLRTLNAHQKPVKSLLFSQDGQFLLSCGADGQIRVWHPGYQEAIAQLNFNDEPHQRPISVLCLALSADGQYLAAGGGDGSIKVWRKQ